VERLTSSTEAKTFFYLKGRQDTTLTASAMYYLFKTPKECAWCIRLPEGLDYTGRVGAWDGIYTLVDYPNFKRVCKAIENSIVKREEAYERFLRDEYEAYLDEQAYQSP